MQKILFLSTTAPFGSHVVVDFVDTTTFSIKPIMANSDLPFFNPQKGLGFVQKFIF
jgi:sulfur relay (sulfurtransferase) DsrF/TusC family protein